MIEPELFDAIELLVDLPEENLCAGVRGAIVECYEDGKYEVEFTNEEGETLALSTLSSDKFIVVWKVKAVMFQRHLGFIRDNYQPLLEQISAQTLEVEAILGLTDEHGQRYRVDLEIIGIQGQREIVRTGWIVEAYSDAARLVTLYVRRRQ
jgi:hypothetical protein